MMGKNKSGMLDSMLAAMITKKKAMEAAMQTMGAKFGANTAKKQKMADQGKIDLSRY